MNRISNDSWSRGYFTGLPYTSIFFRELTPSWLDFAVLLKGLRPPREHYGNPFSYLELGCGTGLGLSLLAAMHPEGSFTGIDFMPEHISRARATAKLLDIKNIQFVEADLLNVIGRSNDLSDLTLPFDHFHYVVCHGLLSWVEQAVQDAILTIASKVLLPEGLFYLSFNTYPGWLGMSAFQNLVGLELNRSDSSSPHMSIKRASETMLTLLSSPGPPSLLSMANPLLKGGIERLDGKDPAYLIQEYANLHWRPVYVNEIHGRSLQHKLRYVATASLPDLFESMMPEPFRALVQAEANPIHRQLLLDLITNRAFRRDIFSKGSLPLHPRALEERVESIIVRLQESPPQDCYKFRTDYGEVTGNQEIYSAIEEHLTNGSAAVGDIADSIDQPVPGLIQAFAMLLHANRIGLDQGDGALCSDETVRINTTLLKEITDGAPWHYLIAPSIGTAVGLSQLEALLLQALQQNLEGPLLAACVQMGLHALNVELRTADGKPLRSDAARRKAILKAAERFKEQRLPYLQALGVVPPAAPSPSEG